MCSQWTRICNAQQSRCTQEALYEPYVLRDLTSAYGGVQAIYENQVDMRMLFLHLLKISAPDTAVLKNWLCL